MAPVHVLVCFIVLHLKLGISSAGHVDDGQVLVQTQRASTNHALKVWPTTHLDVDFKMTLDGGGDKCENGFVAVFGSKKLWGDSREVDVVYQTDISDGTRMLGIKVSNLKKNGFLRLLMSLKMITAKQIFKPEKVDNWNQRAIVLPELDLAYGVPGEKVLSELQIYQCECVQSISAGTWSVTLNMQFDKGQHKIDEEEMQGLKQIAGRPNRRDESIQIENNAFYNSGMLNGGLEADIKLSSSKLDNLDRLITMLQEVGEVVYREWPRDAIKARMLEPYG